MRDGTNLQDTIQTVVKRVDLLDCLSSGPVSKRDLRDELGVSRSTVYKAVGELEEKNLVQADGDTVRLTLCGQLLLSHYQSFAATTEEICHQRSLLTALPSDAPVTTDLLVGADQIQAERHAPSKPLDYVEDLTRNADSVVGFAPVSFRRYVDMFRELLSAGELNAQIVIERPVLDHICEEYQREFEESLGVEEYAMWEIDESLPFGLLVTEGDHEEVAVVVYDEAGTPVGAIANDTPAAVDWGRDVFESYQNSATRVDEDER